MSESCSIRSARRPCDECPWRKDVSVGHFPPKRYIALADTARDMTTRIFACHKSVEGKDAVCVGYALQFHHNLAMRLAHFDHRSVEDGGYPLYANYREMAIANGVDPRHPALRGCR